VVCGTHGVEGIEGSRLQRRHLTELAERSTAPPDGTLPTMVFVHAFEPYGFAWLRSADHDNVDLNRNFVDFAHPPMNDDYARYAATIVPDDWSDEVREQTYGELLGLVADIGAEAFQSLVTKGQFVDPFGVFYGGQAPSWSHRWLVEWIERRWADVRSAAVIDLRTGLGVWGAANVNCGEPTASAAAHRAATWWPECHRRGMAGSVVQPAVGEWLTALHGMLPDVELTTVSIEFGVGDPYSTIGSLREEAWWHLRGDRRSAGADAARLALRAAYAADDPTWLDLAWAEYRRVVRVAIERLSDGDGAPF
jgi:hypothetical protein